MGLPNAPIIKKFFSNKIESSRPDWGDYLLEIADIFSMFDGEELDRDLLADRFSTISGRSPYALRDVSNFRDEFGAYGTYLGLFHFRPVNGRWTILLSKSAKHFLCSTEPDVESFCRIQLAMFQYPNGAGAVLNRSLSAQANAKNDTIREIENNIRINPLRLLCRVVVSMHELNGIPLENIAIPYATIFMLFNDDTINYTFSPTLEAIRNALYAYIHDAIPTWVQQELTNFKRNFHIMARTGIFARSSARGLVLNAADIQKAYCYAKTIAEMNCNFSAFEPCYTANDKNSAVTNVIKSPQWGEYYDALSLPMDVLSSLSDDVDAGNIEYYAPPIGTVEIGEQPFPALNVFEANQIRTFTPSGNRQDPYETIIRREKANREHSRILSCLACLLRLNNHEVYENTFIDLCTSTDDLTFIFEVKSNNTRNTLSQIRKAIAQLYEYRYRSGVENAILCIVLQQRPTQAWVEDYLLHDRNILMCWLVDDVRLECPTECHDLLSSIGIVE